MSIQHALIYARFSPRPDADTTESLSVQHEQCSRWIADRGLELVGTYDDADVSGAAPIEDRPGLQNAMDHAMRAKAVLVVRDLSRIARDTQIGLMVLAQLGRRGASVASVQEAMDSRTPEGELMATMHLAFATFQRRRLAIRTSERMLERQAAGEVMGGSPPYGWQRDPENTKRLIEHPTEQEALTLIRELREQKMAAWSIARELNTIMPDACRGREWRASTVDRILKRDDA